MTPERLEEIRQFINRYGPPNCWTGTLGTACTFIHELLKELQERQLPLESQGDDRYSASNFLLQRGAD